MNEHPNKHKINPGDPVLFQGTLRVVESVGYDMAMVNGWNVPYDRLVTSKEISETLQTWRAKYEASDSKIELIGYELCKLVSASLKVNDLSPEALEKLGSEMEKANEKMAEAKKEYDINRAVWLALRDLIER